VHPVGKTMCWIEKMMAHILMASTSSVTMQTLGEDRTTRAGVTPAVGANGVCHCVFVCHAPRPERCSIEGDTVRTSIV